MDAQQKPPPAPSAQRQDADARPGERQLAVTTSTALSSMAVSASEMVTAQVAARAPSVEGSMKFTGGVVAALLAMKYAGSLKSACVMGLLSGLFAHSFYADVLKKKQRRRAKRRTSGQDAEDADSSSSDSNTRNSA